MFHKTTDIVGLSSSDALVFVEERDDSVDDGYFKLDMVTNQLGTVGAGFHATFGVVTFADGHAEIHRWQSSEVLAGQQSGLETVKHANVPVAPFRSGFGLAARPCHEFQMKPGRLWSASPAGFEPGYLK